MLKVYGRANSINVRKVLWVLEEVGETYEREDWVTGRPMTPCSARSIPWGWCR
jgi:glutathione S-transferase